MKRSILFIISIIILIAMLSACGGNVATDTDEATASSTPEELTPEASESAPTDSETDAPDETPANTSPYDEILKKTYTYISSPEFGDTVPEGMIGIYEASIALGDKALLEIGYMLKDINNDGKEELIIGHSGKPEAAFTKNEIYAVYTLKNNIPSLVFEGAARSAYSLNNDGSFFYSGSGGAAYSIFGKYHLASDGTLKCDEYYFTAPDRDDYETVNIYHNQIGECDESVSEKIDMTSDSFFELEKEFASSTAEINFTPYAKYKK